MKADGTVIIDTRIDTKGIDTGISTMKSQFGKLSGIVRKIGTIVGAAFAVKQLVQFGKEAIQLGSDLAEVQNVVDVTFGNLSGEVDSFAKNAVTQFGLSELSAKQFTSTMGAMLKSMGFTERAAADMGMSIAGLAGDIASFYNLGTEEAFYKIRSGISGETEPLKQLGINLSVANLEQYALTQGITKSYNAMTQQEQALLRYNYLLSVTSDAQGDFSRTSESWANQTRILSEQFNSLKATIGQGLINAFTPVIRVINTVLAGLQAVANVFRQVTALLFGKAASGGTTQKALEGVADGYGAAAEGAEDLAKGTKAAGEAAQKSLAPFDEITKLSEETATGGGDSGAVGYGGGFDLGIPSFGSEPVEDTISPQIQAIVDKILYLIEPLRNIDFAPLRESLANLGEKFRELGVTIGDGLEWVWFNILVPLASWTIEEALPATINLFAEAVNFLNEGLKLLQPLGEWLWNDFLKPIVGWTGDAIINGINGLADALAKISDWISQHQEGISNFAVLLGSIAASFGAVSIAAQIASYISSVAAMAPEVGLLAAMFPKLSAAIATAGTWITGTLVPAITTALGGIAGALGISVGWVVAIVAAVAAAVAAIVIYWDEIKAFFTETIPQIWEQFVGWLGGVLAGAAELFGKAWESIKEFFSPATEWFTKLWDSVSQTFEDVFYNIGVIASGCWEIIKAVWGVVSDWFGSNVIAPVSDFFGGMWDKLKSGAQEAWEGVKSAFSTVATFFGDIFRAAWQKVTEVFSPLGEIFVNIKDGILTAFKKIVNGIISGLNYVISVPFNGINNALMGIKRFSIMGVQPFGGLQAISVPQIPYLAKGAVIPPRSPFAAVLGDQKSGVNVEAPLDTIKQAVADVISKIDIGGGEITINFTGDLAQLARVMTPEITRSIRRQNRALGV